jgi:hypothetical protein
MSALPVIAIPSEMPSSSQMKRPLYHHQIVKNVGLAELAPPVHEKYLLS